MGREIIQQKVYTFFCNQVNLRMWVLLLHSFYECRAHNKVAEPVWKADDNIFYRVHEFFFRAGAPFCVAGNKIAKQGSVQRTPMETFGSRVLDECLCKNELFYLLSLHKYFKMNLKDQVQQVWENRELLKDGQYIQAIKDVIEEVDKGRLRTAEPVSGGWQVNEWVKQGILLYFGIQQMETFTLPPFEFYDKMKLKSNYKELGVRAVPHAVARYGAYLAKNVVLMPSYVNIGAYVDEGTMVDTWATVGSCAQIGKGVHLSGGVGIGGVLEPLQASPVIIEDGCFIGSRCIVVEGVRVEKEAVLGANVVLTQSTKIIDVSGAEPVEMKGIVPARSVVIPGTYNKKFPAGEYGVGCALIIGQRKPSTDLKTSLNDALRDFNVSV